MNEENTNINISYWLLLITFLVSLMIIVGGLTRLTDSGLSITKWDLVIGIIPPLTINDWENFFSLYKKIPEFKLLNSSMSLEEFKVIYWWEYSHRLLGRVVGIFYLIPLLFYTYKKSIPKKSIYSYYLILFLIILQGVVGWYMVKSGLSENVDVSHYRLSLHLTLAFIILIFLFWNYLKITSKKNFYLFKKLPINLPIFFSFLVLLQISTGAFVSGLDAGQIYQTWPLMNEKYFPDDSMISDIFSVKVFDTPSLVQFIHRNIAYLILFTFLFIFIKVYRNKEFIYFKKNVNLISLFLFVQIILGILTIISGAQIVVASMHQIGSIFLILSSIALVFKNIKK